MTNYQSTQHVDDALSGPGHGCLLVRSSGDNYKAVTLHCFGNGDPHTDDFDGDDCSWVGPTISAGRWQQDHVADAFSAHLCKVAAHGAIVHGAPGCDLHGCHCWHCRHGVTPEQVRAEREQASDPKQGGAS